MCHVPSGSKSTLGRILQATGLTLQPPANRQMAVELTLPSRGFYLSEGGELFEQIGTSTAPLVLRPVNPGERLKAELPHFKAALERMAR